tara:strand:- start:3864 stop:4733 length:870 start_codon:yes stop_codon:yes gene_type:complete
MKNLITEQPIDKHLKPVKDTDNNISSLEISTEKVRVKDLEVTGTTTGISTGTTIIVDSSLTDGSTNPVENNAVFDGLATKLNLSGGSMTGNLDMGDQRILDAQRIGFNDGGFITELIDNDDMSNASNTKVSSSESIKAYVDNTIIDIKSSGFNYSSTAPAKVFIPLGATTGEGTTLSSLNEFRSFVVPFDGSLQQVIIRSEEVCGSTTVGFHKSSTGTEVPNTNSQANVAVNMSAQDTAFKFDFVNNAQAGSDNTFSAGDIIAISFTPSNDANDTNATIVLKYDGSQGV